METQKIQTEIYIIYAVADEFYMDFYEETAKPDDYVFGVYTDEQLANDTLAEISQNLKDFEETGKLNLKKTSYAENCIFRYNHPYPMGERWDEETEYYLLRPTSFYMVTHYANVVIS